MNKTRALIASIMAPMVLGIPTCRASAATFARPATQPGAAQDDTQVEKNAKNIEQWLGTNRQEAKSFADIQKNFQKMTKKQLQAALDYLADENRIRRIGSGTKDDPYRYYRSECNEC